MCSSGCCIHIIVWKTHIFGYATDNISELMHLNHVLVTKLGCDSSLMTPKVWIWWSCEELPIILVKFDN
jgi:hypothetical protein